MQGSHVVVFLYVAGLLVLAGVVVSFLLQTRARRQRRLVQLRETSRTLELQSLVASKVETQSVCEIAEHAPMAFMKADAFHKVARQVRVEELSMDVALGILEATRGEERHLSKAKAEELLTVLRNELAITPKNLTPVELVQAIRARLVTLTEMLSEAQLSLTDLEHRVIDIDSIVRQLPAIISNHCRHIDSLHQSIDDLTAKAATKQDVQQVQKELDIVKWAITTILAIILAVLGALMRRAI